MFVEGERVRVNATHIFLVYIMILFGLAQGLGLIATLRAGDYAPIMVQIMACLVLVWDWVGLY